MESLEKQSTQEYICLNCGFETQEKPSSCPHCHGLEFNKVGNTAKKEISSGPKSAEEGEKETEEAIRAKLSGGGYEELMAYTETQQKPEFKPEPEALKEEKKEEPFSERRARIEKAVKNISLKIVHQDIPFATESPRRLGEKGEEGLTKVLTMYIRDEYGKNVPPIDELIEILRGLDVSIPQLASQSQIEHLTENIINKYKYEGKRKRFLKFEPKRR